MNISAYLKRIGIAEKMEITFACLHELQYQHVTQVPFENLDILQGVPVSLNISDMYDKIVTRNRGGVCYKLNGIYNELLLQLGFDIHFVAGTVYRNGQPGVRDTHATNLVHVEQN